MHGVQQRKSFRTSQKIIMRKLHDISVSEWKLKASVAVRVRLSNIFLGFALLELGEYDQCEQVCIKTGDRVKPY